MRMNGPCAIYCPARISPSSPITILTDKKTILQTSLVGFPSPLRYHAYVGTHYFPGGGAVLFERGKEMGMETFFLCARFLDTSKSFAFSGSGGNSFLVFRS